MFVEGATEVAFFDQLLRQLLSARKMRIDYLQASGGSKTPRRLTVVRATAHSPEQTYYIQIVDSGNYDPSHSGNYGRSDKETKP